MAEEFAEFQLSNNSKQNSDGYLTMFRYIKDNQIFFKTYFKLESICPDVPLQYHTELAEKYYDMVIVDLDNEVAEAGANEILTRSDIIVAMTTQKVSSIIHMKEKIINLGVSEKTILSVGRYDTKSKYNIKNLGRILGEKKELLVLPYNTLFFEAAQEGMVTDLFLKLRRIYDKNSGDAFFMEQVKKITQEILKRTDKNTLV